jgi:hypothetical protein
MEEYEFWIWFGLWATVILVVVVQLYRKAETPCDMVENFVIGQAQDMFSRIF